MLEALENFRLFLVCPAHLNLNLLQPNKFLHSNNMRLEKIERTQFMQICYNGIPYFAQKKNAKYVFDDFLNISEKKIYVSHSRQQPALPHLSSAVCILPCSCIVFSNPPIQYFLILPDHFLPSYGICISNSPIVLRPSILPASREICWSPPKTVVVGDTFSKCICCLILTNKPA